MESVKGDVAIDEEFRWYLKDNPVINAQVFD